MDIYQKIRKLREDLNMTQEELAHKVGYKSRSAINKIEAGLRDINQTQILLFAKALHTTPGYLMGWEDEEPSKEEPELKVIAAHALEDLDEEQIQKVIEYAKFIKSQLKK